MASLVLSGDTSGSITVSAPAVAGSTTQTLVNVTGTLAPIVSGTAVTASSTSVDFTGIPSWVKRITVMFSGLSTNGTSNIQVQLGDSGGFEITGYVSTANNGAANATSTTGFIICQSTLAASLHTGSMIISLLGSNAWVEQGCELLAAGGSNFFSGSKTLSDTLTQVRITTVNGTDTFDAGTINILYE
jgi:hypothetical protein